MVRYEHRKDKLLPRRLFIFRLVRHALVACAFIAVSLGIGIVGYRHFEGMTWIDVKSCHPFGIYKAIPKSIIVSRLRRFHVDYDSNSPQR